MGRTQNNNVLNTKRRIPYKPCSYQDIGWPFKAISAVRSKQNRNLTWQDIFCIFRDMLHTGAMIHDMTSELPENKGLHPDDMDWTYLWDLTTVFEWCVGEITSYTVGDVAHCNMSGIQTVLAIEHDSKNNIRIYDRDNNIVVWSEVRVAPGGGSGYMAGTMQFGIDGFVSSLLMQSGGGNAEKSICVMNNEDLMSAHPPHTIWVNKNGHCECACCVQNVPIWDVLGECVDPWCVDLGLERFEMRSLDDDEIHRVYKCINVVSLDCIAEKIRDWCAGKIEPMRFQRTRMLYENQVSADPYNIYSDPEFHKCHHGGVSADPYKIWS